MDEEKRKGWGTATETGDIKEEMIDHNDENKNPYDTSDRFYQSFFHALSSTLPTSDNVPEYTHPSVRITDN